MFDLQLLPNRRLRRFGNFLTSGFGNSVEGCKESLANSTRAARGTLTEGGGINSGHMAFTPRFNSSRRQAMRALAGGAGLSLHK
jgi:hypothetical protein